MDDIPENAPPAPCRLLVLETSCRSPRVGLALDNQIVAKATLDDARRNARDLAPTIRDLLSSVAWDIASLSAVFVSIGPGSYTGLRVGVMSAKTLAFALGCALVAVPTFHIIARQIPQSAIQATRVHLLADAQQDNLYVQIFEQTSQGWQLGELTIRPISELLPEMTLVSGPGLLKWRAKLPAHIRSVEESLWEPNVEGLLAEGLTRWQAGQRDDPMLLEPLYLRAPAAQTQWDRLVEQGRKKDVEL
jgi:tRNA threonylcarbamoyladenosine biosynthesis protein TsaB